ncbi:unnamed protein product [Adineta ricciae]|uniref:Uncharacterized protein n=1 Tax=Adineta ricciae TaxID=249248 RepID=A0A815UG44_ADIRI|nr:unnamed protein product [Adineta ricciae]
MIGFSNVFNSIHVPMIPKGCLKAEFDSTYPVHLNGIINQDEYHQSIQNINRAVSSNKTALIIYSLIFAFGIIGGMICFIIAGVRAINTPHSTFTILISVGFLLTFISSIVFSIGIFLIHSKRTNKLRQIIAQESAKYSSRSPVPCSWRLNIVSTWNRGFAYHRNGQSTYDLIIDIGNYVNPHNGSTVHYSNPMASQPTIGFGISDHYTPPPYSAQRTMEVCSQCGTVRQDLTNKGCSACGQLFNS